MDKRAEIRLISVYAVACQAIALAPLFWFVWRHEFSLADASFWIITLILYGTVSTIIAAFIVLRSGPIDSMRRGIMCGVLSAVIFYAGWFLMFGILPAIGAASDGRAAELPGFLWMMLSVILRVSRGVPLVVGVAGGALYGVARARSAVPR